MKTKNVHKLATLLLFFFLGSVTSAYAQFGINNTAVKAGEQINYKLYFNWKFIWVPAGTATMSTIETNYRGRQALRTSLITKSSKKVDKVFMMRDTLLVYATKDLMPLYYRKGSHEGSRYYVDEVAYSYPNNKCGVSIKHRHDDGTISKEQHVYDKCVYDMLNIFNVVRNYDPTGWKKGHTINVDITGFSEIVKAKLVYKGKDTVKGEDGKKYDCLVLSYYEKDGSKDKEIVRFFVTDDSRHIPIRLDLFLKFGSAKAFMSSMNV